MLARARVYCKRIVVEIGTFYDYTQGDRNFFSLSIVDEEEKWKTI